MICVIVGLFIHSVPVSPELTVNTFPASPLPIAGRTLLIALNYEKNRGFRPLIGLRSAVVSDVDDLSVSDDPVDTELESCVEDVPLLQSPGDGGVVDVEGLHRSQHGHPEVLEIQQVAVSHHDVGDGLRSEVEVEVTVLDDRDVVVAVQEDSRVPSGDGLAKKEVREG